MPLQLVHPTALPVHRHDMRGALIAGQQPDCSAATRPPGSVARSDETSILKSAARDKGDASAIRANGCSSAIAAGGDTLGDFCQTTYHLACLFARLLCCHNSSALRFWTQLSSTLLAGPSTYC